MNRKIHVFALVPALVAIAVSASAEVGISDRTDSSGPSPVTFVHDLAPDSTDVSPLEYAGAMASLVAIHKGPAVENLTGNGGTSSFIIPSAANVAGMNGAFYKTEVGIQTQWISSSIKVNLFAIPNGVNPYTSPGSIRGGTYTLKAFTVYTWDNILDGLGLAGAGYVLAGVDSTVSNGTAYQMNVWANTYTVAPGGGSFRTPVPVITDGALFPSGSSYRHPNVTQDSSNRNNIVLLNIDTARNLSVNVAFHTYSGSTSWTTVPVTLAPGESRQVTFASLFPGMSGQGELALNQQGGGAWAGYVVRTDNGTNDGLLELPYRFNILSWPN